MGDGAQDLGRGAGHDRVGRDVAEDAALESLQTIDPSMYYSTALSAGALNTTVEEMRAIDLLESGDEVDWEGLLDQQFLPEDQRVDLAELQ